MAFIFRPVCHWYSATDVEKIVKLAIQQTVEEMLDRQIADLEAQMLDQRPAGSGSSVFFFVHSICHAGENKGETS
jgi:hypothetical protein